MLSKKKLQINTSFKNINVSNQASAEKVAGTAQARKYGYLFMNAESPNVSGKWSAGRESDPPIIGLQNESRDIVRHAEYMEM